MRPLGSYLRSLDPNLPRPVWLVQAGGVVNSMGNGIAFPFLVIYLHNVRFRGPDGPERPLRRGRLRGVRASAPFAKNYADVSERWVGFIWLANTLLIVLIQLPVSKALEGRRRMRTLAVMSLLWAVSALIVLGGGIWLTATAAALVFVGATLVFGVGETLQGPTQAPLVADLAPDRLRGRYFALGSMSWSAGSILGPAVGGPLLGWEPLAVWPIAAAVCLVAAVGCILLERRLPEHVRRTPVRPLEPDGVPLPKPVSA